jgi:predicted ester cyclase
VQLERPHADALSLAPDTLPETFEAALLDGLSRPVGRAVPVLRRDSPLKVTLEPFWSRRPSMERMTAAKCRGRSDQMSTNGNLAHDAQDLAENAKGALERVCSGAGLAPASRYYSPVFHDHVNGFDHHGLAGAEESVALYKSALGELTIKVKDQLVSESKVTSRFVVSGSSFGRVVRFDGITISRFENGLIVEDWSVTDTVGMLRQLGLWRSIWVVIRTRRSSARSKQRSAGDPGHANEASGAGGLHGNA